LGVASTSQGKGLSPKGEDSHEAVGICSVERFIRRRRFRGSVRRKRAKRGIGSTLYCLGYLNNNGKGRIPTWEGRHRFATIAPWNVTRRGIGEKRKYYPAAEKYTTEKRKRLIVKRKDRECTRRTDRLKYGGEETQQKKRL